MADDTLRTELEQLKQQLQELRAAPAKPHVAAKRAADAGLDAAKRLVDNLDVPELRAHAADFLKSLGDDVRESRPKALVAAFLAGVAVGKLLSK